MLKILQRRLPVELDEQQAQQFHQQLQGRFHSLLAGVRLEYLKRLGLPHEVLSQVGEAQEAAMGSGELFMPEPGTIYFVRYATEDGNLEAGAISKNKDTDFEDFFQQTHQCLAQIKTEVGEWENPNASACEPEGAEPADTTISEKEMEAARELMSAPKRALLEQIAASESISLSNLDLSGTANAYSLLADFEDLDLIRKDYAVIDQKTGQQILRVPSRASLEEASQKFFIGGTPVTEDNVDEVISCTPFCRSLLTNNQWLLYLLFGTLGNLDMTGDSVQVCQAESPATRVFLTLNGQRFMIVLCNRRLTLDDGYLINAQIAAYNLKDVVVVSTDRTSTLMRHHLEQSNNGVAFDYVDSLEQLEDRLRAILLERQREFVKTMLNPLAELTSVPIQELVARKMMPESEAGDEEEGAEQGEDFQAVADSMEIPADELPSLAGPDETEASDGESDADAEEAAEADAPPQLEIPNTEPEILEVPNTEEELASLPSPGEDDDDELPAPLEEEPQLAMPELDIAPAEEFVPDIPSPLEVE